MRRRARLNKLEHLAAQVAPPEERWRPRTDEEWLSHFEARGRDGFFAQEPDFPVALAWYRAALQARLDLPAPDFEPELADRADERLGRWQQYGRAQQVNRAWCWLSEMYVRRLQGEPPVTEAEFAQLAAWFEANAAHLDQLSMPTQCLDLGNGRCTTTDNLRAGIWRGPRARRAGQLVEELRHVKGRYGERCDTLTSCVATRASN